MPDIGDLVQARVRATFCGQPIINTVSFALVAPFGTWTEAADALRDAFNAALGVLDPGGTWVDGLNVGYVVNALDIVDIFPAVAPLRSYASLAVGTVEDDDALPPNDSLCITIRSDFKGAGARGRMYLTGFSEGAQNAGMWLAGTLDYATGIAVAIENFFGETAGLADFRWAVLHRYAGGAPIVPPEVKPVMSFTVQPQVRSIGRRAVGRRVSRRSVTP